MDDALEAGSLSWIIPFAFNVGETKNGPRSKLGSRKIPFIWPAPKTVNEDEMITLEQSKASRKELEKSLKAKVSTITAKDLYRPRTTYSRADCVVYTVTGVLGSDGKNDLEAIGKKEYVHKLECELQELTSAAAQFSNFLKRNAVMTYNDATLDYIDRNIEEERDKIMAGGSRDKFERLTQYRKQYQQEIRALDEQMAKGKNSKLLEQPDVENLVLKLHALPHYGKMLKNLGNVFEVYSFCEQREKSHVIKSKPHFAKGKVLVKVPQSVPLSKKPSNQVAKTSSSGSMGLFGKLPFVNSGKK
ncbi:hypothetical protein N7478_002021 [Penicillium angulare]|uniref:uncharacterized protein n=1 Tax=Penicillium angulare TaxID=116970 RepID=UPI002540076F|nr:uncharacterized protein N7478_002021 [Penicillium angulare]KAJ5288991.1 hypothetical protein N7478_002021 [Penicillium angulare]